MASTAEQAINARLDFLEIHVNALVSNPPIQVSNVNAIIEKKMKGGS